MIIPGKLIGKGNTADVFDIGDNKVVKLFKQGYPRDSVYKEMNNSKLIYSLDIQTVNSYELVNYKGRYGIIYDKIDGVSMLKYLIDTMDLEKYAEDLAIMHKNILSQKIKSATSLKSILKNNIKRTDKLRIKQKTELIKILDGLPDDNCLCHGDFHFDNVMINQEKYYIIDYMNICRGHRYGDIARTVYLIEMTPVPPELNNIDYIHQMKKQATNIYLEKMGIKREVLSNWLIIIAAGRLSELSDDQIDETNSILEYLG